MTLRATPFYARAVGANRLNAWENRGGYALAASFAGIEEEALAARFGAVVSDISWHWRVEISGPRAHEFVSRLFTREVSTQAIGAAMEALWLNDAGAVRGAGTIVRMSDDTFLLVSVLADLEWIAAAGRLYDVTVRDLTSDSGGLALIGPTARKILTAAGVDTDVVPLMMQRFNWRGLEAVLSRFGPGYELWCEPDSALIIWDRLMTAGRAFALRPAGLAALDILEFEAGILRAGRDYTPARDGFTPQPSPQSLGLSGLVDRAHFFNGRAGVVAEGADASLAGIVLDSDTPIAEAALTHQGRRVGRILSTRFSYAMQAAVGFALLSDPWPAGHLMAGSTPCRPMALPILPIPAPIGATEKAPNAV
jgi:glycine cleavage system aminomethyltransferase T